MKSKIKSVFPSVPAGVLFDLDGTLIDSAPDLAGAVNALRVKRGMPELELSELRPFASQGARGLLGAGMGVSVEDDDFEALRDEFLSYYEAHSSVKTVRFEGVNDLLILLEEKKIPWGIITNKHERFTNPLVKALGLDVQAAVVVSGDTTAHAKPHPLPLLHAAKLMGLEPGQLIYIGDDERDIQSARAAGYMGAIAASYGYCRADEVDAWCADAVVDSASEIAQVMGL